MGKRNVLIIILVFCLYQVYQYQISAQTISINTGSVIHSNHEGFGIQFHADQFLQANKIIFGTDDNQWQNNILPYITEIDPKVMKMSLPVVYWEPWLGQTTPDSDWMNALYKVLDEFRARNIRIKFQEWCQHRPSWCFWREENYAPPEEIENFGKSVAKMLKHLILEKGYYNIDSFTVYNEPNNYFSTNALFEATYRSISKYLKQENVPVKLGAPHVCQLNRAQAWDSMMIYCMSVMDDVLDEFTMSMYSTFENFDAYTKPKQMVDAERTNDKDGKKESIFLLEGETQGDSGVREGEYYIDITRAGTSGVTKWWCMDHYFIFSWEALQKGNQQMLQNSNRQYVKTSDGKYEATVLGCKYSYRSGTVYATTVSGSNNIKAICIKDNDSDSYTIYVYNSGSSANVTFNINNNLNKTFQKFVHPSLTSQGTVTMTNGLMTNSVPNGFTVYYGQGAKETTPPSAPTNLVITALSPRKVKLTWNAATDNVRVERYNIYKNGGTTPVISVPGTVWEDTHVTPGTNNSYVVKAVDGAGNESTNGASGNINVPNPTSQPPTTPQNIKIKDSLAEIELEWTPSTDDNRVAGYRVYEQLEGESKTRVSEITGSPLKTNYISKYGFASCNRENVKHYISISAFDDEGNESVRSSSITVLVPYGQTGDFDGIWEYFNEGFLGQIEDKVVTISGSNNSFRTATIGFTPSGIKQIFIRLKNNTTRNQLLVAWENYNGTTVDNITTSITTNDTTYKEYLIDLTSKSTWAGQVSRLYFFFNGSGDGTVDIDYIRIGTFPVAKFTVSKTNPNVGESVSFNGTSSTPPPGGTINQYLWDFGDGQSGSGATVNHSYSNAGIYTVKLKCIQDELVWGESSLVITVGNPAPEKVVNVDVIPVTKTRIDISWTKNTETDISAYKIYRSQTQDFTPGPGNLIATVASSNDYYCDKSLSANTLYYYKVTAVDTASQEGPPSDVKSCKTRAYDPLFTNGDWETGAISGWNGSSGWSVVSPPNVHEGNYAVHRISPSGQTTQLERTLTVTPGQTYRVLTYLYIVSHTGNGAPGLVVAVRDPSWNPTYASVDNILEPIGKWFYKAFEFKPIGNQIVFQFYIPDWSQDAYDFYVDDVYIDAVPGVGVPPNKPTTLLCDGQSTPKNVTNPNPVLSWTFSDSDAGDTQSAYQILVSTNQNNINSNIGDAWDTGTVYSSQSQRTYNGKSLILGATYYWKVRTWDSNNLVGPYSDMSSFAVTNNNNPPNAPTNTRCNGQNNPQGITDFTPDLSWTFSDPDTGQTQSAYRILVADNITTLNSNTGNKWDTNKVNSSANVVTYDGAPLASGLTYYWKVMTWDGFDTSGPYSAVASFSMTTSAQQNNPPQAPTNLKCDNQTNPKNITNFTPELSWTFNDPDISSGDTQYAYRLLVSNNITALNSNTGNMWDTNKVISSVNHIKYAGTILQPTNTYYWKVMTWDQANASSPFSNAGTFVTGVPNVPVLQLSTTTLDFGTLAPGETKTLTFNITNPNPVFGKTLNGTISADQEWIIIDPPSFTSDNITIYVTVDNNILKQLEGEYTGKITVTSTNGEPPTATVDVLVSATCVLTKPNPYHPDKGLLTFFGDGIVPGETKIKIYTLSGELVKTLTGIKDRKEITWDGKNESGEPVISGIYLYVYESPKEKGTGKFTLITK